MMKKYIIAALALGLVLCAGCSKPKPEPAAATPTETTTAPVTVPTTEETKAHIPSQKEVLKSEGATPVKTDQFDFVYPKQWTELTEVERIETEDSCFLRFHSTVGTLGEIVVFSLYIGPGEFPQEYSQDTPENTFIYHHGTLDGLNVYTMVFDYNTEELSEEDAGELGRQQEYINEIILQIYDHPDFVAT